MVQSRVCGILLTIMNNDHVCDGKIVPFGVRTYILSSFFFFLNPLGFYLLFNSSSSPTLYILILI